MTTRHRTIEWEDPATLAQATRRMGGREFLQAMIDGDLPAPPIARTLDFTLVEVGDGRVVFEFTPQEFHYNPLGSVHGGVPAAVFDAASSIGRVSETDAEHPSRRSGARSRRVSRTAWLTRRWS